jgi:sugar phosphate isomerase/epimerase
MKRIVVPTSVFGYQKEINQGEYAALIAESGGQGIEIRRELFSGEPLPLEECRRAIEPHDLIRVYSAPVELWLDHGGLNESGLSTIVREAQTIQADIVKMSLGHFNASLSDVSALSRLLQTFAEGGKAIRLTVENDQTAYGGKLQPIADFFKAVSRENLPVRLTFDMGNWTYCGEDAMAAADLLSEYVVYIHCKHVEPRDADLVTLPLPREMDASWRELLRRLPSTALRAIEFTLPDVRTLSDYIAMMGKA